MKNANSGHLSVSGVLEPVGDGLRRTAAARTLDDGSWVTRSYCVPKGNTEDAYAVGHSIAQLLDRLDAVNESICHGEITNDTASLSYLILHRLKSEGWRVRLTALDRWDTRPPAGARNVE